MNFEKMVIWSDSTIVLNWINSPSYTHPTFVANRIAEIQSGTNSADWRHVRSHDNPADFVSRGQIPMEFKDNTLWFQGPKWLSKNEELWPVLDFKNSEKSERDSNEEANTTLKIENSDHNLWEDYNSFLKFQVIVAYCLRFASNSRIKDPNASQRGKLTPKELLAARDTIMKQVQAENFSKELSALRKNKVVDKTSRLLSLNPFIDNGLIRVGGRINKSNLSESRKYPIILPRNHKVTYMVVQDVHGHRFHAGVNATLYGVRELYWPLDG